MNAILIFQPCTCGFPRRALFRNEECSAPLDLLQGHPVEGTRIIASAVGTEDTAPDQDPEVHTNEATSSTLTKMSSKVIFLIS